MKIIFCDVDGVLVTERSRSLEPKNTEIFDKLCVSNLRTLILLTDAHIVISSTWRNLYSLNELKDIFNRNGLDGERIIDVTPNLDTKVGKLIQCTTRGCEIQKWLSKNKTSLFCIIDDQSDMEHSRPYLIKTTFGKGLETKHIPLAVKMLNDGLA